MEKCIIAAVADNGAIGANGNLPWHLSEDLKFFKRTTLGCPVIMGRTTFESIGRPLPGRSNIVLTSSPDKLPTSPLITCSKSLDAAFESCAAAPKVFIIGGASVYAHAIKLVDKLYITHIHTQIENADAFFPEIDADIWKPNSRSETFIDPETGYQFEFVEYILKK